MITVRFPSGFSIQYDSANQTLWTETGTKVRRVENGQEKTLFALVPHTANAVFEYAAPCRTYDANSVNDEAALEHVLEMLRERRGSFSQLRKIGEAKALLQAFNRRRSRWA